MARIAGVDLPREKRIEIALTYIYGIGRNIADDIIEATGVNPDTRVKDLTEQEIGKLRDYIDHNLKVEGDKVWVVSTKPLDPATITVKGPGYERVFTVTTDNGGTGVDGLDSDRTPLSVRYFTLDGMEVTNPAPGTTVVRITLFTDGTAATEKVVIR